MAKSFSGKLMLGGPEAEDAGKDNRYILEWIDEKGLDKINIYPSFLRERLKKFF